MINRDPQNISAVLLADGWHAVGEGDSARFLDIGWKDFCDKSDERTETGMVLEFWSDKYDETIIVPINHVLAYRLDERDRSKEIDEYA